MSDHKQTDGTNSGLHYLWHLESLRLIKPVDNGYEEATSWLDYNETKPGSPSRIVIVDNGCTTQHPNLETNRVINPVEFTSHIKGLRYKNQQGEAFEGLVENLKGLTNLSLDQLRNKYDLSLDLDRVLESLAHGDFTIETKGSLTPLVDRLSAHGTACAGLVAANPLDTSIKPNPFAIRYHGIDKHAYIIPVATVYSHEYWPMVMALLYAVAQDADVILIPRAVEEMSDIEKDAKLENDDRSSRLLNDVKRANEKALFEELLEEIAPKIPVVIAAGNSGGDELEYPAKLVRDIPELIIVGAANSNGYRSSYSAIDNPKEGEPAAILYAPSNDHPMITTSVVRYDEMDWRGQRIGYGDTEKATENHYSPYGVVAIDLPGQDGYNGNEDHVSTIDTTIGRLPATVQMRISESNEMAPSSLYSLFGGTSAACSIAAGVASVIQTIAKNSGERLTGVEMKELLHETVGEMPPLKSSQLTQISLKAEENKFDKQQKEKKVLTINAERALQEAVKRSRVG